jgi:transposase
VDVPAKLAARVRLFDTGHNRKTDALDAHSIAIVAMGTCCATAAMSSRGCGAGREPAPPAAGRAGSGQGEVGTSALQAKAILASVRPRDVAGKTRRRIAAEELAAEPAPSLPRR